MTKKGAILAMMTGRKVTHRFFSPDEWITMEGNEMVLEDGVRCDPDEFWRWRILSGWEDGWSFYNE